LYIVEWNIERRKLEMPAKKLNDSRVMDQLNEFEIIMDSFFRHDPVEEVNTYAGRAVDDFNTWVSRINAELESKRIELERHLEPVRLVESQIESIDQKLEPEKRSKLNPLSLEEYNRLVSERNELVDNYNRLVEAYQLSERRYNDSAEELNQKVQFRKKQIEASKKEAEEQFMAYKQWLEERGPENFFKDVNAFYASLHIETKRRRENSQELKRCLDDVRKIRNELGELTRKKEEMAENGLFIVKARLCDLEQCYFIVDTGATVVTITKELVNVLGIEEYVGPEIEFSLPAGMHVKAPQLLIPRISINGKETQYVKGVVMKESLPGVDGCLGISFLNRFDYTIEKGRPARLILNTLRKIEESETFDTFICHGSIDFPFARKVSDFLTESGHRPFLREASSEMSLMADYQKTTDCAIESAMNLVVVCSSVENVTTPWVEAEWRLYDSLKKSGDKLGGCITILCGDASSGELPEILCSYPVVSMNDSGWRQNLVSQLSHFVM
jgi:clan AA aspartic protease (TIGR02281 family)